MFVVFPTPLPVHGNEEGWTTVIGKKKRKLVSPYLRCLRGAPEVSMDSDSESDSDTVHHIPGHVAVHFCTADGKSGLQVKTRCTQSWSPIAAHM